MPLACSLRGNYIGVKGASALAAVLKETTISDLKCAAAPRVFAFVSVPLGMPPPRPSLGSLSGNDVGEKGATAIAANLNETKITKLKCAAAPYVRFRVSAH